VQEAIRGWKTPLFGPHFHQTGYIVATTGRAPQKATDHLNKALSSIADHKVFKSEIRPLKSAQQFHDVAWQFSGPLTGFTGYFNRLAGYAHSSAAMEGVWTYLAGRGVKFVLGMEKGRVDELVYTASRTRCTGVRTADGQVYAASRVIVAAGAWASSLLPALRNSVTARCWSVAHVQLTQAECDLLRFIPTTNVRDLGFFFEPDPETRLFKLCPLGAGYTNNKSGVPQDIQDYIPREDEQKLRWLLREVFPWMAERPFVEKRMCWFADTGDSEFCIDFVPGTENSVVVLSGDSGHGFKMMPVFGKWVVKLLNDGQQTERRWSWKAEGAGCDDVSWRIGESKEIDEVVKEMNRSKL
jgi:sarcosine oxidase / L-pipecolate oxidase